MSVQANIQSQDYPFLRRVLQANTVFSTVSGLLFTTASGSVATFLGGVPSSVILALGIGLLLFAAYVGYTAFSAPLNRQAALSIIIGDVAWVVASAILLFAGWISFTTAGWWAVAIIADIVAVFAVLEWYGLRNK